MLPKTLAVYTVRIGTLFGTSFHGSWNAIVDAFKDTEKAHRFCDRIEVTDFRNDKAVVRAKNGETIGFIEYKTF